MNVKNKELNTFTSNRPNNGSRFLPFLRQVPSKKPRVVVTNRSHVRGRKIHILAP